MYAYAQVAIYGVDFVTAAKATWGLFASKGFEMMKPEMPKKFNDPKRIVNTLNEIWFGPEMNNVRCNHMDNKLENIEICKMCPFKETYKWEKVNTK